MTEDAVSRAIRREGSSHVAMKYIDGDFSRARQQATCS